MDAAKSLETRMDKKNDSRKPKRRILEVLSDAFSVSDVWELTSRYRYKKAAINIKIHMRKKERAFMCRGKVHPVSAREQWLLCP